MIFSIHGVVLEMVSPSTVEATKYTTVKQSDTSEEDIEKVESIIEEQYEPSSQLRPAYKNLFVVSLLLCAIVVSFLGGIFGGETLHKIETYREGDSIEGTKDNSCQGPVLRREWRSLAAEEKRSYLKAAKCLTEVPSTLGLNQSHHDDFAWVHKKIGETCECGTMRKQHANLDKAHDAAMFIAWHRYFIHAYEKALQTSCDFKGHLAYWDWTLDWEDITKAPVWSSDLGFGGDGNRQHEQNLLNAHCVTDGPFANLNIPYIEDIYYPHCLSRGFETKYNLSIQGEFLRPEYIEKLLANDDYEEFNLGMEHGPHIAIPKSVNGDFSVHTAPFGEFLSLCIL